MFDTWWHLHLSAYWHLADEVIQSCSLYLLDTMQASATRSFSRIKEGFRVMILLSVSDGASDRTSFSRRVLQ